MTQRTVALPLAVLFLTLAAVPSLAQGVASVAAVSLSHVHLNVTSIDAHREFWVTGLGGTAEKLGSLDVVRFPHGLLILTPRPPIGGSKGSVVNHIGLYVQDLRATAERLRGGGFRMVAEEEWPRDAWTRMPAPAAEFRDGIGFLPPSTYASFVIGPDGAKVELVEKQDLPGPVDMGHVHFFTPIEEGAAWYEKLFGGSAFPGPPPRGVRLNRDGPDKLTAQTRQAGTRGRVYDHIGFEVRNLEEFTRHLAGMGIEVDRPYSKSPEFDNVGVAFLTDPWGTSIELTEGLANAW